MGSNAIEIHDGIALDFYTGLPHMLVPSMFDSSMCCGISACHMVLKCHCGSTFTLVLQVTTAYAVSSMFGSSMCCPSHQQPASEVRFQDLISTCKSAQEQAARVRACNYVKFETGWNLLPVLKIVTRPAHAVLT